MSEQIYSTVPGGETTTIHTKEQRTVTRRTTRQGLHGPEQEEEIEVTTVEHTETTTPMIVVEAQPSIQLDYTLGSTLAKAIAKVTRAGIRSYGLEDRRH